LPNRKYSPQNFSSGKQFFQDTIDKIDHVPLTGLRRVTLVAGNGCPQLDAEYGEAGAGVPAH